MNITTKFDAGDEAYVLKQRNEVDTFTCAVCGGTGKLHIRETGEEIDCTSCYGTGSKTSINPTWIKEKVFIKSVNIHKAVNVEIVYYLQDFEGSEFYMNEDCVYTDEEANEMLKSPNIDKPSRECIPTFYSETKITN